MDNITVITVILGHDPKQGRGSQGVIAPPNFLS